MARMKVQKSRTHTAPVDPKTKKEKSPRSSGRRYPVLVAGVAVVVALRH